MQLAAVSGSTRVVVERDGQRIPLEVKLGPMDQMAAEYSFVGFPHETVLVERLTPNLPADRAGLMRGDQIVTADGVAVLSRYQLMETIRDSGGRPIELRVQRGDAEKEIKLQLRPTFTDPGDGVARWVVGVNFTSTMAIRPHSFTEAVPRAVWFNVRMARTILGVVANLFRGKVSIKQLEGPVSIARHSGQAARMGLVPFLFLTAIISLNLGILNLLPIPILDGGHLLMLAIEGTMRRDLSVAVKERFVQVGMVFLLLIFAIVMYNDVLKMFTK